MKSPAQMSRTAILVEGALMVAIAFALSLIPHPELPLGGSISVVSTLPIIIFSLRHSWKWGIGTAAVYGVLQMMQGMKSVLWVKDSVLSVVLVILLDYVLAYACIGLTGPIARRFARPTLGIAAGILATGAMRFVCSLLVGVIVWGQYLDEGVNPWIHSVAYNVSWCVPDVALVLVAALALSRVKALHILPARPNCHSAT